jgi:hypothetical protein
MTFFFSNFFFNPRGFQWGRFRELKMPKSGGHPEIPKTGSPLAAKGELVALLDLYLL